MIVTIRKAEERDYKGLMKLYNDFMDDEKLRRFSKEGNDSFNEVLSGPNSYIYIAEENEKMIGFVTCSTRFVIRYPKKILHIEELFVSEEYRKHGIGKRLVETMEEKARDLDCGGIYIESRMKKDKAHEFYEHLGYEKAGYYFKKSI